MQPVGGVVDYFTHISGSRPKYHPTDVVEWESLVEAVELFTPAPETSHAPLLGELKAQGVSGMSAGALTACGNRTAPKGPQGVA